MKLADFFENFGKQVRPEPDDKLWWVVETIYRNEITTFVSAALGSTETDINRAWGAAIDRINELIRKKNSDVWGERFLPFLKQAVLDEVIVCGLKNGEDTPAVQLIKRKLLPEAIQKLSNGSPLNPAAREEIISEVLAILEQRAKAGHLPTQTAHMHDAVLDEVLISAFRCAEPVCSMASKFIRKNWFDYILTQVPNKDLRADIFNVIIGNFSRRINSPQKGEKLVLEHALKTYLYRCVTFEVIQTKKKSNENKNGSKDAVPNDPAPSTDDTTQPENYKSRWHGNNLSPSEMYKVITEIPRECKEIFLLVDDGYTHKEIGEKLNIATGTVNNRRSDCYDIIENLIQKIKNNDEK